MVVVRALAFSLTCVALFLGTAWAPATSALPIVGPLPSATIPPPTITLPPPLPSPVPPAPTSTTVAVPLPTITLPPILPFTVTIPPPLPSPIPPLPTVTLTIPPTLPLPSPSDDTCPIWSPAPSPSPSAIPVCPGDNGHLPPGICVQDLSAQIDSPAIELPLRGTLTWTEPLNTTQWSPYCPTPPGLQELHTLAPACPTLPTGSTTAPVTRLPGVFCGPMIPSGQYVTCSLFPFEGNTIDHTGLTMGFDRDYNGFVYAGSDIYTRISGYDGVLRLDEGEHAQDPHMIGPGPTMGITLYNLDSRPARIIAYPTDLDGSLTVPSDRNRVGCDPQPVPGLVGYSGTGPTPAPGGNETLPTKNDGTFNVTQSNVTLTIPIPANYQGELNPVNHARLSHDAYTTMSGGTLKPICSCGQNAGGAQDSGGSVDIVNGEFVARYNVLTIASARGQDWRFNLTYRTLSPNATHVNAANKTDIGYHWDFTYGKHFKELADGTMEFHDGDGLVAYYKPIATTAGTTTYTTPPSYYDALTQDQTTNITLRTDRYGTVERYVDGRLSNITDRNGNNITFHYNATNVLIRSIDSHHRIIDFHYDPSGRMKGITDFAGRGVTFTWCKDTKVLCQIVSVGGTSASFYYEAHGAMTRVYDANGKLYLKNYYDDDFRVILQRHGDQNQLYRFLYRPTDHTTTVFDRNKNRVDYHYTSWNVPLTWQKVVFNNRHVDPADAPEYITNYQHNRFFEITHVTYPNGNFVNYTFDQTNANHPSRGNLLSRRDDPGLMCVASPDPRDPLGLPGVLRKLLPIFGEQNGGPNSCLPRITSYTYEGTYNQPLTMTDARGNDPTYAPQNGGLQSAARYRTTYEYDAHGNPTIVTRPVANPSGAPTGFSSQATSQPAVDHYAYNALGQLVSHTDALGIVENYTYYPADTSVSYFDPGDHEGYLWNDTKDVNGLHLKTNYTYDPVGDPTTITDPAGRTTRIQYDGRCLIANATGPAVTGQHDALSPQAKHVGQDNVTVDEHGRAIANRTRVAYAVSANETQREANEAAWTSLPRFIDYFLMTVGEQKNYTDGLRIYVNGTGEYHRDTIHGTYHAENNSFLYKKSLSQQWWETGGEFVDVSLTADESAFLRGETGALQAQAAQVGGPVTMSGPLQNRTLTLAANWTEAHTSSIASIRRDGNGQATSVIRQTDSTDAQPGAVRLRAGGKVDVTTYNVLGQVIRQVTQTAAQLPDVPASNVTKTQFFYDYNENLVCKHYPLRVQALRHWFNVETWIYDERDLLYDHSRGNINQTLLVNLNGEDPDPCGEDPHCTQAPPPGPPDSWPDEWKNLTCHQAIDHSPHVLSNYDGNGNLVRSTDALGHATTMLYDGFNERIVTLDALANRAETYYDLRGNVVQEKKYEPQTAQGALQQLLASLGSLGGLSTTLTLQLGDASNGTLLSWSKNAYDELNRKYESSRAFFGQPQLLPDLVTQNPEFVSDYTEHDALGRVIQSINANGHASTTLYDNVSRVLKTTDAAGNYVSKQYDVNGNVVWERHHDESPDGFTDDQELTITRTYDSMNRLVNESDDRGHHSTHVYDGRGTETASNDATGHIEKHVADGAGRAVVDYYRLGTHEITGNLTFSFYVPGLRHDFDEEADNSEFEITYTTCAGDSCDEDRTCLPEGNATCRAMFRAPCAVLDDTIIIPHNDDCCHFLDDATQCIRIPEDYNAVTADAHVNGNYSVSDWPVMDCLAARWPLFRCPYTGPMHELFLPALCTFSNPMVCGPKPSNVTVATATSGVCINTAICTDLAPLPNGTVLKPYLGPYWDQLSYNGTWNGTQHYYGITLKQRWDLDSRLVARIDGEKRQTNYTYDDLNRQFAETFPDGKVMRKTLDANDNVIVLRDPVGSVITNTYDELNRLIDVKATHPVGVVGSDHEAFTYDGLGRKRTSLDEKQMDPARAVRASWVYDSLGNVVKETTKGYTVTSNHDAMGNRVRVEYPGFRIVQSTYDSLERLSSVEDLVPAVGGLPAYAEFPIADYHYVGHRLAARVYANGIQRNYTYVDEEAGSNTTLPASIYDYDSSDWDVLAGFNYTYDSANHKLSTKRAHADAHSESYALDAIYRLVDYRRGALGADGVVATPAADGLSRQRWNLTDGNDWRNTTITDDVGTDLHVRQHNARHELTGDAVGMASKSYTYDDNGNLRTDGQFLYGWDFKNRLVEVRLASGGTLFKVYGYDADNRRVSVGDFMNPVQRFFVLDGKQEVEERNMAGRVLRQWVYGPRIDEVLVMDENALATDLEGVPVVGPTLADATGNVTLTQLGGTPLAGWQGVDETVGSQQVTFGVQLTRRYYYIQDDQMSVVALADEDAKLVEGYEYTPYGKPTVYTPGSNGVLDWGGDDLVTPGGAGDLHNPYKYTARNWDADTGLSYYRTRYMSPEMGRFISSDTIGVWGDAASLGNAFAYGADNPSGHMDPTGTKGYTGVRATWKIPQSDDETVYANFFIHQPHPGGFGQGDDRDFSLGSGVGKSRVALTFDFKNGQLILDAAPSCANQDTLWALGVLTTATFGVAYLLLPPCRDALPVGQGNDLDVDFSPTFDGKPDGIVVMEGTFMNSYAGHGGPANPIHMRLAVDRSDGAVEVYGERTKFPTMEITQGNTYLCKARETVLSDLGKPMVTFDSRTGEGCSA